MYHLHAILASEKILMELLDKLDVSREEWHAQVAGALLEEAAIRLTAEAVFLIILSTIAIKVFREFSIMENVRHLLGRLPAPYQGRKAVAEEKKREEERKKDEEKRRMERRRNAGGEEAAGEAEEPTSVMDDIRNFFAGSDLPPEFASLFILYLYVKYACLLIYRITGYVITITNCISMPERAVSDYLFQFFH